MEDWRKEFQYLLDRKILSRDELGFLFGQIKSIVDSRTQHLQAELKAKDRLIQHAIDFYGVIGVCTIIANVSSVDAERWQKEAPDTPYAKWILEQALKGVKCTDEKE